MSELEAAAMVEAMSVDETTSHDRGKIVWIRLDVNFFDLGAKFMTEVTPDSGHAFLTPGQVFGCMSRFLTWVASPRFQT